MSGVSSVCMGVVAYGSSRVGRMHIGWIVWPLATDGAHFTDRRVPFRWWALWRARRMAANAGIPRPATDDERARLECDGPPADYLRRGAMNINLWL